MTNLVERLRAMTEADGFECYVEDGMNVLELTSKPDATAQEAADRIEELERRLAEAREANRKLHRRAQLGEGLYLSVKVDLEMWLQTLQRPHYNAMAWMFSYTLRHMERRVRRYQEKLASRALSDSASTLLQEQKDNAGKEGE